MKNRFTWSLLYNPFIKIAGWQAFALGMVFVVLTGVIGAKSGVAFDGVIDAHLTAPLSLKQSFLLLAIDIVLMAAFMFAAGLIIVKKLRFADILGTMTLARVPLILLPVMGFFVTPVSVDDIMSNPMVVFQNVGLIIFSMLCIPLSVWYIALLYNGFKVSTGAKGSKLIIGFILGLISAEIVSKILILKIS